MSQVQHHHDAVRALCVARVRRVCMVLGLQPRRAHRTHEGESVGFGRVFEAGAFACQKQEKKRAAGGVPGVINLIRPVFKSTLACLFLKQAQTTPYFSVVQATVRLQHHAAKVPVHLARSEVWIVNLQFLVCGYRETQELATSPTCASITGLCPHYRRPCPGTSSDDVQC